jgi:N-acylneuraminate cytidylyltransferase
MSELIALIPARAGSKRVQGKNIRLLSGHPLLAYTICAARESQVFDRIVVSTNCAEIAAIARNYGAEVPFLRPEEFAGDFSPDIQWIQHALGALDAPENGAFSILRPTSPFRLPSTIQRARECFFNAAEADSLRAVELCQQHPGKMWTLQAPYIEPLLSDGGASPPWHSRQYQALPPVYVQNGSLEMAWNVVPLRQGTIAGRRIIPFFTEGYEGFDINRPTDWILAEALLERKQVSLPSVSTVFATP